MATSRTTASLARWSATHPWRALLVWLLFLAAALGVGSVVSTRQTSDADFRIGQSGQADAWVHDAGMAPPLTEAVVISPRSTATSASLDRAAAERAAEQISRRMARVSVVRRVGEPTWSPDHRALLVPVVLAPAPGGGDPDVAALQAITASVQATSPALHVAEVGETSINAAVNQRVSNDLGKAERLSLPITLLIMLIAFGALIAAGIPVLLAITGVLATIALYAPLSHLVPADDTVSSMVLLIGMAVGVDYSLFYLKREREERERGRSTVDAVTIAAATSGHSIVVSGAAVMVAMAGLYVVQDASFSSLATGAILVVAISVIGSLTVLPALLSKLGRWVDRPRVPLLWRVNRRIGRGGISRRILAPVLSHPKASLGVSTVVVLALATPVLGMRLHEGDLATLPQDIPTVQTMQQLEATFPSEGESVQVVVKTAPEQLTEAVDALHALGADISRRPGVAALAPDAVRTSRDRTVALLTLDLTSQEGSDANVHVLSQVRGDVAPTYLDPLAPARWAVGGGVAVNADYSSHQSRALPWVIGFVLLLTLLMMGFTFRSVPIAILTTVLNLASVGAAFGILTLVFQNSWAEELLGFTSSGFVVDWIPLFMFVVLIGLSMDYHVFVLSRIREGIDRGLPPRLAVEAGVKETAGVVTSAATVMVSVFAIFATLSMLELKQIGVGLAASVLVDATLVRIVMLPSLLVLMGRWAWWPSMSPRQVRLTPVTDHVPDSAPGPAPALVPARDGGTS
jgi:RND superfamily putative drug exporter